VADILKKEGVSCEVIDPRTLVPLDRESIFNSVKKTGRLVVADEDYHSYGVTGEIITSVVEIDPTVLKSPPIRVASPDASIPFSRPLEAHFLPSTERILAAARKALS